jgi:hypothetical protein
VFDEIPHSEKVLKRHQNSDDPCIMAWDHYNLHPDLAPNLAHDLAPSLSPSLALGLEPSLAPSLVLN